VRVLGWSAEQPYEALARGAPGAFGPLGRPRPPVQHAPPRSGASELALAVAAGALLLRLRRRPLACVALGLAASVLVVALARGRTSVHVPVDVVEWDAGTPLALRVTVARDALALPASAFEGLEVLPEGSALELVVSLADGAVSVQAPGNALAALAGIPPPDLAPVRNGWEPLEAAWTRDARGAWSARGAWELGAPLPEARRGGPDPPGWLASALPPGRGVLLGRGRNGVWLRGLGFETE
jgi:hypothetical protein